MLRYLAGVLSCLLHCLFFALLFEIGAGTGELRTKVLKVELVSVLKDERRDEPVSMKNPNGNLNMQARTAFNKPSVLQAGHGGPEGQLPPIVLDRPAEVDVGAGKRVVASNITPRPQDDTASGPQPDETGQSPVVLRQGRTVSVGNTTVVLKTGAESRTMGSLAGYHFDEDDFRGHYETNGGRQVVVIDARSEHGCLILHDRKTGLTRKLKKAGLGEFIYTYGPSFDEDVPVEGSVVFLPGDGHWIYRFMWLPEGETAEYPVKGRVDSAGGGDGEFDDLYVPACKGVFPAVVLVRFGADIMPDRFSEVARHLCGQGVVVLVANDSGRESILNAIDRLVHLPKVDKDRVGIWFRGYEAEKIPRIPEYAGLVGFVIVTIDSPKGSLYPERFASAVPDRVPSFVGLRNVSVDWKNIVSVLVSGVKSVPIQLTVLNDTPPFQKGVMSEDHLVDSVSGDFVSSISAWLDSQ